MPEVMFLCTGNYYRSRLAEIYFNWLAERDNLVWRAFSRGLAIDPLNPGPMSRHTIAWLDERGIPHSETRLPEPANRADFQRAQHVVAVKALEHQPLMMAQFPDLLPKVEFWAVHDVDCATPAEALPGLAEQVELLVRRLANLATSSVAVPPSASSNVSSRS